ATRPKIDQRQRAAQSCQANRVAEYTSAWRRDKASHAARVEGSGAIVSATLVMASAASAKPSNQPMPTAAQMAAPSEEASALWPFWIGMPVESATMRVHSGLLAPPPMAT